MPGTRAMLCTFQLIIPTRGGDFGAMYSGIAMCSNTQNLLPFSLKSCSVCTNSRKEDEDSCKARSGMNVEINVRQTLKTAVTMNLQLKLVFTEVH